MKENPFAIIAVFTDLLKNYKGNTAGVVLLKTEWNDQQMQQMAADLNQPATTFLFPDKEVNHYSVRWFAPDAEIGLCGHGSMAAIAFLYSFKRIKDTITLKYSNGAIEGRILDDHSGFLLFTSKHPATEAQVPELLQKALGISVKYYFKTSNKDIVLVEKEDLVKNMTPDFSLLRKLKPFGYIVTAPGDTVDFVSRTLVPHVQQLEDHATGSSHVIIAPFWAEKLNKNHLIAHQLSKRGGKFECKVENDYVLLSGNFTVIAEGKL